MTENIIIDHHDTIDIYDILDKTVDEIKSVKNMESLKKDLFATLDAYFHYKTNKMTEETLCCFCNEKFDIHEKYNTKEKCDECKTFCHYECKRFSGNSCKGNINDMLTEIDKIKQEAIDTDKLVNETLCCVCGEKFDKVKYYGKTYKKVKCTHSSNCKNFCHWACTARYH